MEVYLKIFLSLFNEAQSKRLKIETIIKGRTLITPNLAMSDNSSKRVIKIIPSKREEKINLMYHIIPSNVKRRSFFIFVKLIFTLFSVVEGL